MREGGSVQWKIVRLLHTWTKKWKQWIRRSYDIPVTLWWCFPPPEGKKEWAFTVSDSSWLHSIYPSTPPPNTEKNTADYCIDACFCDIVSHEDNHRTIEYKKNLVTITAEKEHRIIILWGGGILPSGLYIKWGNNISIFNLNSIIIMNHICVNLCLCVPPGSGRWPLTQSLVLSEVFACYCKGSFFSPVLHPMLVQCLFIGVGGWGMTQHMLGLCKL